ncbi:MAG: 30S ribosomal protein S8 [Candidatus Pelagibacter sp. TMED64]|nr:30S ribosomal protein S8 [Candidatus Pelagibacter sp.]OUU67090.1 MAG: 30S ribosomal protein S8 [Candidatus Pelagibacter sp. TMED64]
MSFGDPIGDMLARIKNGQMRSMKKIDVPASNFRGKILDILTKEGYIINYKEEKNKENKNNFKVDLKYSEGSPVIKEISRVSKPGRRIYASADSIPRIQNGMGIAIVSTSKGVMTDEDARKQNIGGEVICRVF